MAGGGPLLWAQKMADLAVKPTLKPLIRSGVLADARLIYAA
jgi:hypothetical protein